VRLSVSRQRREKRKVSADDLDQTRSSNLPGAEESLERRETVELGKTLWELAEDVLSEDQYLAVWLRYAEGMAMADIAKVIGKSQVGVRVSLFRARAALAQAAKNVPALADELNGHGTAASRGVMDDMGAARAKATPMTTVGGCVQQGGGR
jgi:DNA-directed RNA polymerase specialized sigma24 family protein